jgi:ATP-binding cassette subfamily B protein
VLGRYYADNGKDLSGGEWQLVGLARTYFKKSEYMILDEPSAALDPISEDRIFEQLYHLGENKTSVTISHRLSNTTLADRILVIDDGRIIEQGSHFELLRQKGKYAHLFNLQANKYI